ncbi:MAG: hypothetical protein H6R09_1282 [Proteobacteria bacterium]|nr:hypothetical protein [Pseudomonadota bacterium]
MVCIFQSLVTAAVRLPTLRAAQLASQKRPAMSGLPAHTAAIPADDLFYQALVTPHPPTRPQPSEKPRLQAPCTPPKVIRT